MRQITKKAWLNTNKLFIEIQKEASKYNAEVLVLYTPSVLTIKSRDNRLDNKLDLLKKEGIKVLNLNNKFQSIGWKNIFLKDKAHLNEYGNKIVAEELYRFIYYNGLYKIFIDDTN